MIRLVSILACACAAAAPAVPGRAAAQDYPVRPIRIVIGYAPGGLGDTLARVVADKLGARLGQPVIVENKPGAGGVIAAEYVARAAPDGYTLLQGTAAEMTYAASMVGAKLGYDATRDFAPISMLNAAQMVLVASPALGVKSVPELRQYAGRHSGKLNYASFGVGSSAHFAAEIFKSQTGMDITHIPFKGSEPAVQEVAAGRVQLLFNTVASSIPYIQAGRLVPLAVTGQARADALPEVPTFGQIGLSGVDLSPWAGLFAPKGTPAEIVRRLNGEVRAVLTSAEVESRLTALGAAPLPSTPEALGARVAQETETIKALVKKANLKFE
ncbi:Tripartite tricarboxylate transporter family receptor [Pigmentiphaga humi]|uniref:Tripartite tricarboxylate transporter family receptor n=1 Tax=Pigmentiphaga humi TaxID=2478468 RepID=A0A3P4B9J6_9BURK|nr:tripartite tricarboxylate transporter substrate binding protein [Pigmentiphaga humi]VCU71815.1 Tripartite tricarboxylate transporter family receptor [Pigmentiphaga humi]